MWKRSRIAFALLGAALLSPRGGDACSMCRCGDPTFALVGSQIFVPNTWHVGLDMDRYSKDQVAEADPTTREREVENRLTLAGTYTLGPRWTLVARIPFASRTITTAGERVSLFGLSDPELLAHYRVASSRPGSWVSVFLGLRPGWGQNDRQRGGVRAEEHLQPATGAAGLDAGLAFSRVVGAADDGAVYGSVGGRVDGRNSVEYHYGNALLANLGYERKLGNRWNAVLEVNFRTAAKDEPAIGESDPNTGGSVVYVSPRLLLKLDKSLFLRLGLQVPVVKGLDGDQDEKVNVLSGLTVRF